MDASVSKTENRKHILCLDDDADTCEMMDKLLEIYGYDAITAHSVAEAQAAIEIEKFDLLIFDSIGLELCQQIRKYDPNTPILFVSGLGFQSDIDDAMKAGAQVYIVKPFNPDELEQVILQFIN